MRLLKVLFGCLKVGCYFFTMVIWNADVAMQFRLHRVWEPLPE
jgi:hypothetical protein